MKRLKSEILVVLAAAALALSGCFGADTPQALDERETYETVETMQAASLGIHGMISRIEHGDNVAYVFGSMHAGRAHWFPLAAVVEDAMRRADVFVFEYDMSVNYDSPEMVLLVMEHMFLPDGVNLADLLPPDVHAAFVENINTYDWVNYEAARAMHPFSVSQLVMYEVSAELGVLMEFSVDAYVYNFAARHGMPVLGLNDIAEELAIASDMPEEAMTAFIAGISDKATLLAQGEILVLADAYEANDMTGIRGTISDGFAAYRDDPAAAFMRDVLMHQRCVIFADEIERLLRETEEPSTFFITVGLAHIIGGEAGQVLNILRDRGFDVAGVYR
ncbi:MAG: TraB/GumN family protein [Defluviitaleaceae bacterium]|nr:TraB/GumN family protein [Defluviitaleaceae bacterium]